MNAEAIPNRKTIDIVEERIKLEFPNSEHQNTKWMKERKKDGKNLTGTAVYHSNVCMVLNDLIFSFLNFDSLRKHPQKQDCSSGACALRLNSNIFLFVYMFNAHLARFTSHSAYRIVHSTFMRLWTLSKQLNISIQLKWASEREFFVLICIWKWNDSLRAVFFVFFFPWNVWNHTITILIYADLLQILFWVNVLVHRFHTFDCVIIRFLFRSMYFQALNVRANTINYLKKTKFLICAKWMHKWKIYSHIAHRAHHTFSHFEWKNHFSLREVEVKYIF